MTMILYNYCRTITAHCRLFSILLNRRSTNKPLDLASDTRKLTTLSTTRSVQLEIDKNEFDNHHTHRLYCKVADSHGVLSDIEYHTVADNTLESLAEKFDEIGDLDIVDRDYDNTLGQGVLTIKLGGNKGTFVINKQSPNKQIWLSSPKSGPKRYDYVSGQWIYKHNMESLHNHLSREISELYNHNIDFNECDHSGKIS